MRRYIKILSIFLIVVFIACDKDECEECVCGKLYPENNIDWLKEQIESRPFCTYVYTFKFSKQQYISIEDCPGPDSQTLIYDCNGEIKCEIGGFLGGSICNMPKGFTYEYYLTNKTLIYQNP